MFRLVRRCYTIENRESIVGRRQLVEPRAVVPGRTLIEISHEPVERVILVVLPEILQNRKPPIG